MPPVINGTRAAAAKETTPGVVIILCSIFLQQRLSIPGPILQQRQIDGREHQIIVAKEAEINIEPGLQRPQEEGGTHQQNQRYADLYCD